MKSDPIFYELFQAAPQTFFELIQVTPPCPYTFKSITVKTTEKRIDGILEPTQVGQPIYFVEVQAYPDDKIYWRTLREIATYFEQEPTISPWRAFVLWLDETDDEEESTADTGFGEVVIFDENQQQRLFSVHLIDVLRTLSEESLVLNVLRPLTVNSEAEVRQQFPDWVGHIQQSDLDTATEQRLMLLMSQLIEQKFKTLDYEELARMLKLTPFRETRSYRKALAVDLQDNYVQLLTRQIKRRFKFADSTMAQLEERLRKLPLEALEELFEEIIDMETLREIKAWVSARTLREESRVSELTDELSRL